MTIETVTEIVNPSVKSGTSEKTGKPWTIKEIRTDSGKSARGFDDVQPGDKVEIEFNDQYKNYNFKAVSKTGQIKAEMDMNFTVLRNEILTALKRLEGKIDKLVGLDAGLPGKLDTEPPEQSSLTKEEIDEIPF